MSRPIEQEKQIKFLAERFEWRAMSSIPLVSEQCLWWPASWDQVLIQTPQDLEQVQVYKSSSAQCSSCQLKVS